MTTQPDEPQDTTPQPQPVPSATPHLTVHPDDDDLDEPLGKACSLDNPDCESCQ